MPNLANPGLPSLGLPSPGLPSPGRPSRARLLPPMVGPAPLYPAGPRHRPMHQARPVRAVMEPGQLLFSSRPCHLRGSAVIAGADHYGTAVRGVWHSLPEDYFGQHLIGGQATYYARLGRTIA